MKIIRWALLGAFLFVQTAQATILWTGGEEIDFPKGAAVTANLGFNRSGYGRHTINVGTGFIGISNAFPSGPVTSAWLSVQTYMNAVSTNMKMVGLGKSGTSNSLWIGTGGTAGKIALWKYDGTTWTLLASEAGVSVPTSALNYKYDMQVINYGASATVNIYVNGSAAPKLTFTGDVTAGGNTNLDNVQISQPNGNWTFYSEFIVADVDTRLMSVVTLAPSAAGTTNQWTGAYTDISESTLNDATLVTSATSGQNFQCNFNDLPSGSFAIKAVKATARAVQTGGGIASLALGLYTNATVSVPSASALTTTWDTYETLYQTNPVTSSAFTPTEVNALQLNLQSAP
jgi:hypothetical protein